MTSTDLLLRAQRLREQRTPFVLATVVRAQRPTSAKPGDSALVLPDGSIEGFVGGVCAASTVRLQGLRLIDTGASTLLRITPDPDSERPVDVADEGAAGVAVESEGLVTVANPCLSGGTLDIFLEAVLPPALVHVFGDTPVAQALAKIGGGLGYHVQPSVDPEAAIPDDTHAVVIASHGRDEEAVLRKALDARTPYLAMVASRKRAGAIMDEMDLSEAERARVHAPAGLDIGARGALEIALSIFAEMIAERPRERTGSPQHLDPLAGDAQKPHTQASTALRIAIDPVCGMEVAITPDALAYEHAGVTYYFCSSGCRKSFAKDPDRYLA
jgi:xanthine dehydrogenase accessory factor